MTKLKPCPFCGGEALLNEFPVRKGYEASIQCDGGCYCFALMTTITYDFPDQAREAVIAAWNRRDGEQIMRLIDAEWITYVLRKIAQAEDKDLSKGEFGQGYVSGVYHAIHVIKSTEACLPKVCKHCHLVQYHDNNYCDRCGRLIDKVPTVEERKHGQRRK